MDMSHAWQMLDWIAADGFSRLGVALGHFLWQGCVVAVVYAAAAWFLRGASANTRYVAGVTALLLMAACLPVTLVMIPPGEIVERGTDVTVMPPEQSEPVDKIAIGPPLLEPGGPPLPSLAPTEAAEIVPRQPVPVAPASPPPEKVPSPDILARLLPWASILYLCGVFAMLTRVGLGLWGGRRLRRDSTPVADTPTLASLGDHARRMGMRAAPLIAACGRVSVPLVVGIFRPMILIPSSLITGLTPNELEAVLVHELAHIRRFDPVVNVLQRLVEAVLFFHPAVWWISRCVSVERENACDDLVLRTNCGRNEYATALVHMAELCVAGGSPAMIRSSALAATGKNGVQFRRRVLRVLKQDEHTPVRLTAPGIVVSMLLILALMLAPAAWRGMAWAKGEGETVSETASEEAPAEEEHKSVSMSAEESREAAGEETSESAPTERSETTVEETIPAKTVHGKVVDENGTPIPGADVWMMPVYDPVKENPAAHTTTDAQGRFVVAVPEASEGDPKRVGGSHGRDVVLAYAEGHQLGVEAAREQLTGRDDSDVVIRLKPAVKTEFVVWGPDGKPKAGAVVEPRHIEMLNFDPPKEVRARIAAKTDAEGRAVLTAVPREVIASVDVITDDLGTQNQTTHTTGGGGERAFEVDLPADKPIRLKPCARIVGRITAEKPEWTRGVRVVLSTSPVYRMNRPLPPWPTTGRAEVVSDDEGRFEVPAIAEGALHIKATVDEDLPVLPVDPEILVVDLASKPKKTIEVEIPLVRKIPARGHVRVAKSGEPIPGVILQINYGTGFRQSTHVTTDENGNYTASVLPGMNQVAILGFPDGYRHLHRVRGVEYEVPEDAEEFQIPVLEVGENEPAETPMPSEKPSPAEKPPSERSDQPPSRRTESPKASSAKPEAPDIAIHGRVGDEAGTPISGAKLWLPVKYEDDKRLAKATTDESGRFTLRVPREWTEPGRFYPGSTVWCYAPGRRIGVASAWKQLKGQSDAPVEIVLASSTDTGFEVKALEGDLIRGARVEPMNFLTRSGYELVPTALREVAGAETNDRGVALLPAMGREGLFLVRVTTEGYGVQELQLRNSAEEPAIRPVRLSPTGRLEGRLSCDDPSVFEGLRVYVQPDQPPRSNEFAVAGGFAEVDEKGRFIFPACAEGPIRLIIPIVEPGAWAPRIPENLRIAAGETTEVEVPFEHTVRVRGRVRIKETDAPVVAALVSVSYGSVFQSNLVRTGADGRFETTVLPGEISQYLTMKPEGYWRWVIETPVHPPVIRVPADVETFDLPPLELISPVKHRDAIDRGMKVDEIERSERRPYR